MNELTDEERSELETRLLRAEAFDLSDDLSSFVHDAWPILEPVTQLSWNWHLDLIAEHLTLVKQNKFKEKFGDEMEGIIFNVPPRSMKSIFITVMFPVWLWTSEPERRFMFASYDSKLSTQHSLLRRNIIDSKWYRDRWTHVFQFASDQNLKTHYTNSAQGQMFSTSMNASATGLGGDCLIFDDPLDPDQALSEAERKTVNLRFDSKFRSRINSPKTGCKIIVMQRLHEEDLTGHILSREKERWVHLKLPAIAEVDEEWKFPISGRVVRRKPGDLLWPDRLSKVFLDGMKGGGSDGQGGMGTWAFAGQFQQNPAPLEGGLIKRAWIRYYRELPERFEQMFSTWDCTFKDTEEADYVAGQVWGRSGAKYMMLPYRVYRRMDFGPTLAAIKDCVKDFPSANVLIEDKANGSAIISELQKEVPGVIAVEPYGGKLARAQAMAPLWEAGSVELPDPEFFNVPWLNDYIHNVCTFPKAAHDDDVDATSQALNYMRVNSFGLLEVWKAQALAAKQAAEKKPESEQEIIRDASKAVLKEAALTSPAVDTMQNLGNSLGLMPQKAVVKKVDACARCGNTALAKYSDFMRCNCGWDSRLPYQDFLIDVGNPEALNQTLRQLVNTVAVVLGAPDFPKQEGYYVMRSWGLDHGFLLFACERQGYCRVIEHL